MGTGTGFFTSEEGLALSNWHVLEDGAFAFALLADDKVLQIERITRKCEDCDLVEFQVLGSEGQSFNPVEIDDQLPAKGSSLIIIGCPENYRNAVSAGLVAAMGEVQGQVMVQTEASISPGSSGSPVFNADGKVFAVATQTDMAGQNLNFCLPLNVLDRLEPVQPADQLTSVQVPIYVFNQRCAYNNVLTLHSLAFYDQKTVAHFSFVNLSLVWGDGAFIFTSVGDENAFKIQSDDGNEAVAVSTTIGNSDVENTGLQLGETRRFTVQFPPFNPSSTLSLREGEGDWRFSNLKLDDGPGMKVNSLGDLEKLQSLWMTMLTEEDLSQIEEGVEFLYLNAAVDDIPESAFSHNLEGVIHYLLNDLGSAKWSFEAAAEMPGDGLAWLNLYAVTPSEDVLDELMYLNQAIVADPQQPETRLYRARLHYSMENWRSCLEDFDRFFESGRQYTPVEYGQYGVAQIEIGLLDTGCENVRYAFDFEAANGQDEDVLYWLADLITSKCPKKYHK